VFTQEAAAFASGRNIHLVNGSKLTGLLRQARGSRQRPDPVGAAAAESAAPSTASRLACPNCEGPMLSKRARRGPNAGGLFWGCAAFPDCKGTRPA
jgi:restriction system protein